MEQLMKVLHHQTSITQRWQQMLLEQSESTKYLQTVNTDTANLLREQAEATKRVLQVAAVLVPLSAFVVPGK